ncbi:MAG TPA: ParB/RepB/Spo0J family partition protein [Candidatus Pacearchaeota archaeon]|nr:ParB/RepB/Spo0J family partition protein [Candidatus Pacearchaeota archaeon]
MSRGLESLIPKKGRQNYDDSPSKKESIFWIETNKIKENPYQPRVLFKEEEINSLAESIKKYGVLQPLIVTKIEKDSEEGIKIEYELIAGERRLRACQKVNIDRVPVIIREPTIQEKLELALIENVQRKNLNPMEKAEAYLRLKEEFGLLEREIAEITGKSREAVSNGLRLLNLPLSVKQALKNEVISEGHAKVLLALENEEEQNRFLKLIIEENWSVRKLEQEIKAFKNPKKELSLRDNTYLEEFENRFKQFFKYNDLKVKNSNKNYQVIINFKSKEEMENYLKNL